HGELDSLVPLELRYKHCNSCRPRAWVPSPPPIQQLPVHKAMCYKRYMRKWTKDRAKRRPRKPADTKEKGPAPEPLQPKYFDSDLAAQPPAPEPSDPPQPARESQLD